MRADQFADAVNRTAGLYSHLDDPQLRAIVTSLDRLPTVPHVYLQITQLAARPDATLWHQAGSVALGSAGARGVRSRAVTARAIT